MFRSTALFSVLIVAMLSLAIVTSHVALATSNITQAPNQTKGLLNGTTIELREITPRANQTTSIQNQTAEALPSQPPTERSFMVQEITPRANQTTSTGNQTAEALPSPPPGRYFLPVISAIARGYFGLGDWESVVHVTSDADFLTCIWARNVEIFHGGVQITTPASDFQGRGSTGHPSDALVLNVPAQTGMDLGCIGADARETIDISNAFGARVVVYLTVITAPGATVNMIGVPRP